MRTISHYVEAIIAETPFFSEVLSEGIGNSAAIARLIHKDIERRMLESVSVEAIAMAIHRLPKKNRRQLFGYRFLKKISDITLRSNLTLFFVHNAHVEKKIFERLASFEAKHPGTVFGVTKGLVETLLIIHFDVASEMRRAFGSSFSRAQQHVSSITMRLPSESMQIPGVYYPILKALAWEGINVVELVSAGEELTVFVEDANAEKALRVVRNLSTSQR